VVHLRLVVPPGLARRVRDLLTAWPVVVNVIHLEGASLKPRGDVILCDVAREDASVVISELRSLGLGEQGSIVIEPVETSISEAAVLAERAAKGSPADAVVWEQVESRTSESAELSFSFLAFMVLATLIAACGIMTDSQILIIGAMVVGPEFGPLAGLAVAIVQRRLDLARRSFIALAVGFPVAILASLVMTLVLRALGPAPDELSAIGHPTTLFISHPNTFSVIVALLAGITGVLSLTTAKSGALIGVLISVTTIPAAANVGVAAAYGDWSEFRGALAQLGINLVCLIAAGVATLMVQRWVFERRRERYRLAVPSDSSSSGDRRFASAGAS
jgi:uncharacterized hydrophobic protein (TIGR00271 family)